MFKKVIGLSLFITTFSVSCLAHSMTNRERSADLFQRFSNFEINHYPLHDSEVGENYYKLLRLYMENLDKNFGVKITAERLIGIAVSNTSEGLDLDPHALELATFVIKIPSATKKRINELQSSNFIRRVARVTYSFSEGHKQINMALLDQMVKKDNDVLEINLIEQFLDQTELVNERLEMDPELPSVVVEMITDENAMNDQIRNHKLVQSVILGAYPSCSIASNWDGSPACRFTESGEYKTYVDRTYELARMQINGEELPYHFGVDYFDISNPTVNLDRSAMRTLF